MQQLLGITCGLDIHKDLISACILRAKGFNEPPEAIAMEFTAMRGDLMRLRDWLVAHNCPNVAMESTGVYWKPVYEILEGIEGANLCLTNSYHMRNVPGRKDDDDDAQWIASLHMCGLLDKSFVPEKGIRDLREYTRFHIKLTQSRVRIVNRIEKFLQTHGFKLSSVLSSITGVSSLSILEKLCEHGEISVEDVASSLERGVRKSADEIAYAINGKLLKPSQMLLRLMLDSLYSYDRQLENLFSEMTGVAQPFMPIILLLATIPGLNILSATYIIAEIGVDMGRFKKGAGSLASWAGLSPRDDKSAGKIISNKILKGNSYVKSILCQCAWAATKTRGTRPSNWYWRNVKRLGEKTAIIAVARKLLVYIHNIIVTETPYDNQLDADDTGRIKALKLESVKQQVSKLEGRTLEAEAGGDNDGVNGNTIKKTPKRGNKKARKGQNQPNLRPADLFDTVCPHEAARVDGHATTSGGTPSTGTPEPEKRGGPKKNPTTA